MEEPKKLGSSQELILVSGGAICAVGLFAYSSRLYV